MNECLSAKEARHLSSQSDLSRVILEVAMEKIQRTTRNGKYGCILLFNREERFARLPRKLEMKSAIRQLEDLGYEVNAGESAQGDYDKLAIQWL